MEKKETAVAPGPHSGSEPQSIASAPNRKAAITLVGIFLLLIGSVGLLQTTVELRRGEKPGALGVFGQKPTSANLRAYEHTLEDDSVVARALRPIFQFAQFEWLKDGGEKALVGRDGWLFYKPGYDAMVSSEAARKSPGDPVEAIVAWRDALAARGIQLLVVPAPNKESIYPDRLCSRDETRAPVVAPATRDLLRRLGDAHVEYVNLFALFSQVRSNAPPGAPDLYLHQDSHWSPKGLELAAQAAARRLVEKGWVKPGKVSLQQRPMQIDRLGDVLRMLQSPPIERHSIPEKITCNQVVIGDPPAPYKDEPDSEVLVLGDSFLRIFEQDAPGAAGFTAHLARELKQPAASLVNDGGASTLVRQELFRRPGLLKNKRVVVWEFVERDIRLGTEGWQKVPLPSFVQAAAAASLATSSDPQRQTLRVRLSWGHRSASARDWNLHLQAANVTLHGISPEGFESEDRTEGFACRSRAGGGDVDALVVQVSWTLPAKPPLKPHSIWQHLLDHGDPGQVARLKDDPGLHPDSPLLTVVTAPGGTNGFSVGLDQLARHKAMWLPEHDVFVSLTDEAIDFPSYVASLKGERVLDRVRREPESTLAEWTNRWADFGNSLVPHHGQETSWLGTKGHLTGLAARHGALYKFGVDRWGNVRPDHASPHKFRLDVEWPGSRWTGQHISNGLPILVTTMEKDEQRCEIEQFAALRGEPSPTARGEIPSVLLTRIRVSGPGPARFVFRLATESTNRHPEAKQEAGRLSLVDRETGAMWLEVEPGKAFTVKQRDLLANAKDPVVEIECAGEIVQGETETILLRLPSPAVPANAFAELAALDYTNARSATVDYWDGWLARGARFEVPEAAVNDLFRANLWHALMLPRFRADDQGRPRIDLPYSNFAYGQLNADWPINQAVYVDYMLYGLRGYFKVAEEEFAAMYQSQQKPDGRVGGFAEWGVYSPGMLYSIAQNYLLSGDRTSFERLLPSSLRALDWCLREVRRGTNSSEAFGCIVAPLNDLTHDARAWGFPNAYFVAGLDMFGRALKAFGHPRATDAIATASRMRTDVEGAFARASVKSAVVQLADGTWNNYVPCDALTPRRLLDVWYPTDVDCGSLHLARLSAINPRGWLASAMLQDHEDNLFLNQWGMANEPVYNQQATAYLLRDEPEAAIRAFYSMMACAFSHHQLTPLEHRWAWGQYYMPPSTDGAWFELYRNLLVNELAGGGTLFIGQAVPRAWLDDGKRVKVTNAQTWFGPVNLEFQSQTKQGSLIAEVAFESERRPETLLVRLRHPAKSRMKSATVNGADWSDFDPSKEWVRIPSPSGARYRIEARY
jgi:hypothetical protein